MADKVTRFGQSGYGFGLLGIGLFHSYRHVHHVRIIAYIAGPLFHQTAVLLAIWAGQRRSFACPIGKGI